MKRLLIACMLITVLLLTGCASNGINGAMGGAAGGALLGQMIGRNTEGTLIGAAAGGLLGYIGGNEYDKFNRDYRVVPRQQQPIYDTRGGNYQQRQPVQYRQTPQYQSPPPQQQWQPGW